MKEIRHLCELKKKVLRITFSKIVKDSNSSKRMNLAKSLSIESPKIVHFGRPPIETNNVGNLLDGFVTAKIENSNGIWRSTYRDNRMEHTHDIEIINEKDNLPQSY